MTPRLAGAYSAELTGASRMALLELARALGPYRESLELVGGWVPYLLLERHGPAPEEFLPLDSASASTSLRPSPNEGPARARAPRPAEVVHPGSS